MKILAVTNSVSKLLKFELIDVIADLLEVVADWDTNVSLVAALPDIISKLILPLYSLFLPLIDTST